MDKWKDLLKRKRRTVRIAKKIYDNLTNLKSLSDDEIRLISNNDGIQSKCYTVRKVLQDPVHRKLSYIENEYTSEDGAGERFYSDELCGVGFISRLQRTIADRVMSEETYNHILNTPVLQLTEEFVRAVEREKESQLAQKTG